MEDIISNQKKKIRIVSGDINYPKTLAFQCPACGEEHKVFIIPPSGYNARWRFNGDYNRPTFKPSIKVQYTKYENGFENWEHGDKSETVKCHSIITDGQISFCGDSTHSLAGQTVDLPQIEETQTNHAI